MMKRKQSLPPDCVPHWTLRDGRLVRAPMVIPCFQCKHLPASVRVLPETK